MKILFDSNILISAGVFKSKNLLEILEIIKRKKFTLILSDSVISETKGVVRSKFARFENRFLEFFKTVEYELFIIDETIKSDVDISDPKDRHVILTAQQAGVDVLITGDSDFFEKDFGIRILRPSEFLTKYA